MIRNFSSVLSELLLLVWWFLRIIVIYGGCLVDYCYFCG